MSRFEDYRDRYRFAKLRREEGILELQLHTDGGPLQWTSQVHEELEQVFLEVGRDHDNDVVILTGAGDAFSGPAVAPSGHSLAGTRTPATWDKTYWEGKHLLMNLLNIEVPVIAAINGPALRHAEIPVMSDIVLAAPEAAFQDTAHFAGGLVPGDGMHIVFPLLMGLNRGRYFLLTGQRLSADEAMAMGLVNEIVPRDALLERAWTLARQLMLQPRLNRRYTRTLLVQDLKVRLQHLLGYGLALEGLAASQPRET